MEGVAEYDDICCDGEGFVSFFVRSDELFFVLYFPGFGHDVVGEVREDEPWEVEVGVAFGGEGLLYQFLMQMKSCRGTVPSNNSVSFFHVP